MRKYWMAPFAFVIDCFFLLLIACAFLIDGAAQDQPKAETPRKTPATIEELQKQLGEKDSQIATLSQQVKAQAGELAAINKLYGGCYRELSADEARLAK